MIKYIFMLLTFMSAAYTLQAQQSLFDKVWKIEESYADYHGQKISFYNKDSVENSLNYSGMELIFQPDSTYQTKNQDGEVLPGTWSITKDKDSLELDEQYYKLIQLNDLKIITQGYRLQLKDTLANFDTIYTYMVMYPVSLVTGNFNARIAESFSVFPNPVSEELNVDFANYADQVGELRVLNVTGGTLATVQINNQQKITINTADFPNGFYIILISDKSSKLLSTRKLIKQKTR